MIEHKNNLPNNTINQEKVIYDYLRDYIQKCPAEAVILEFSCIFLEGKSQNKAVRDALENIILSKSKAEKFTYILNYCFHIVINYWLKHKTGDLYIVELITLWQTTNYDTPAYSRLKNKVLLLNKEFIKSSQYQKIQRIALILRYNPSLELDENLPLAHTLARYPYLYKPLLVGKDNITELISSVRKIQRRKTKSFEIKLSQHIIYRIRLVEIAKARQISSGAGKIIQRIPNPTLLSHRNFKNIFKQYLTKIDHKNTLYQLARKFIFNNQQGISYREYKRNLYFYLLVDIESRKPSYNFPEQLWTIIDNLYYQSDTLPISPNLSLRTCRKLYQSLIISTSTNNKHEFLLKLISGIGTAKTATLLIKIALVCPQAKADLEQRLAILYSCYQDHKIKYVPWIIKLLEHILVAFSIYFGKVDISLAGASPTTLLKHSQRSELF